MALLSHRGYSVTALSNTSKSAFLYQSRILPARSNADSLLMDADSSKYHTTSKHKALLKMPTLSYDGMADFWVRNYEDFEKAYEDPFYLEVVKKDEEYLFDLESLRVTAGVEHCVIEDGKVVQEHARKI
jgi:hypothetical protein